MNKENFHIWEGIHNSFPENTTENAWDSDTWVESQVSDVRPGIEQIKSACTLPGISIVHEYPLAPIVALLAEQKNDAVRILDFGGGLASSFPSIAASLPNPERVEFEVVESKPICQKGRQLYSAFANVAFHEHMPEPDRERDIIHAGSSLHYVRDWKAMLRRFADYQPTVVMLSGLMAGEIKTFASYQNYYGAKCPVWFWNVNDILDAMHELNFKLTYKSLLASRYLGKVQSLPMDNFPVEYRLDRKCNLVFSPRKQN